MNLVEIGPRFVLTPIRIFEGAFSGATVFANPGQFFIILKLKPTYTETLCFLTLRICFACSRALSYPKREGGQIQETEGYRSRALRTAGRSQKRRRRASCAQSFRLVFSIHVFLSMITLFLHCFTSIMQKFCDFYKKVIHISCNYLRRRRQAMVV